MITTLTTNDLIAILAAAAYKHGVLKPVEEREFDCAISNLSNWDDDILELDDAEYEAQQRHAIITADIQSAKNIMHMLVCCPENAQSMSILRALINNLQQQQQ